RRRSVRPIARTNVVVSPCDEAACGSQKTIDRADRNSFTIPTQDERHVIGVGESTATTDVSLNIRSKIVLGERESGYCGEIGSARKLLLTHPGQGIHVHKDVVFSCNR